MSQYRSNYKGGPRTQSDNSRPDRSDRSDRPDRPDRPDNRFNQEERKKYFAELNKSLVGSIYDSIDISKYNFKMLKDESDLSNILTNRYYLSGNYSGVNCLLVFTKLKGKFYSFVVERKMLSYSVDKVDWDNLRITNVNVMVDQAIYNGTIFDGIYFSRGDVCRFTITDAYRFKGSDYSVIDLKLKLNEFKCYFERIGSQINRTGEQNKRVTVEIDINQIYDIFDFDNVVNTKLHTGGTMPRGICFYPEKSGTKLIFNYDHKPNILFSSSEKEDEKSNYNPNSNINPNSNLNSNSNPNSNSNTKSNPNKNTQNNLRGSNKSSRSDNSDDSADNTNNIVKKSKNIGMRLKLRKTYYTSKDNIDSKNNEIKAVLSMVSTSIPDNYELYCVERIDTNKVRKQKRDIAYIPDAEKSRWLRSLFDQDTKPKLMNCVWRDDRRKWEPISINTSAKIPTLSSKLDEYLIEVEESDSESDFE